MFRILLTVPVFSQPSPPPCPTYCGSQSHLCVADAECGVTLTETNGCNAGGYGIHCRWCAIPGVSYSYDQGEPLPTCSIIGEGIVYANTFSAPPSPPPSPPPPPPPSPPTPLSPSSSPPLPPPPSPPPPSPPPTPHPPAPCACSAAVVKNVVEFRDLVLDLITPADSLYASISLDASRMAGNPLGGTNVYAAQVNGSLYGVYYRRSSSGRTVYHIKQTTSNTFGFSSQFRVDLGVGITSCPFGTSFVYTADDFYALPTLQTEGDVTVECDISPPPTPPHPPSSDTWNSRSTVIVTLSVTVVIFSFLTMVVVVYSDQTRPP